MKIVLYGNIIGNLNVDIVHLSETLFDPLTTMHTMSDTSAILRSACFIQCMEVDNILMFLSSNTLG